MDILYRTSLVHLVYTYSETQYKSRKSTFLCFVVWHQNLSFYAYVLYTKMISRQLGLGIEDIFCALAMGRYKWEAVLSPVYQV